MKSARWRRLMFGPLLAVCALSGSGCAPEIEKPTLEDMALIGVMGIDYVDKKHMKVSVSVPVPSEKEKESTQLYAAVSKIPSEATIMLSSKADRTISLSQLRVILFGEKFVREWGLRETILDFYRNPAVGENVVVAVVGGKAEDVIKGKYENKPEINTYLNNLLRPREETAFTSFATLHDLVFMLTNQVSDPELPYLKKEDGEIVISGVAAFRGEHMVGTLSQREGRFIQMVKGRRHLPSISFIIEDEYAAGKRSQLVFDIIRSHSKVRSNGALNKPVVDVAVEVRGILFGYTGSRNLEDPSERSEITRKLGAEIEKEITLLLKKLQKKKWDPASIEESFRQKYRGEWGRSIGLELYQKAEFRVKAKVEIIGTGTMN
ncbi:Ger(x)C family spore germination protein [Brevibacillus sp. FSL K6-2834]|uniref:Ger(x)C family spore germination protein n=1 Tax=Brevibacillus sp. FSL K6-2834 TaxID=2954680 RepID=UPI003159092C